MRYLYFSVAYQKIAHVLNVSIGRVIFEAWHTHTLDARRQREYFEVCHMTLSHDFILLSQMINMGILITRTVYLWDSLTFFLE